MPVLPSVPFCKEIPDYFTLGETNAEIKVSSAEENRNAILALAEQARYSINIFTQDMDNAIYDNEELENHIFNLATRHPNTQIRILVQDSRAAVKKGHRLIRIAQKLTSSILIKNPPETYSNDKSSFMTVDRKGIIYTAQTDKYNYEASVNFMSPQRTAKLDEFFNDAWYKGEPDQRVRRLSI
ncbi:MAG: hypothetical protein OEM07_04495 [Gammaproteobacteria bacterium]|nr:hypothetical protein [Gammaproteobacteria bacterium]